VGTPTSPAHDHRMVAVTMRPADVTTAATTHELEVAPATVAPAAVDDAVLDAVEGTDLDYTHVAVRGVVGGWLIGSLVFVVLAWLGLRDAGWGWWLGVGLGTALWVGPFFGLLFANAAFQLRLEEARRRQSVGHPVVEVPRSASRPIDLAA
jgi:hypothetical protein